MIRALSLTRWVVVGLVLAALVVPAAFTFVTGLRIVAVDGESMTPTYQMGDVVLIGAPAPDDLHTDQVVTVQSPDGSLYTHRVIKVDDDGMLQLKGDGNSVADPVPVNPDTVVGVVRGHLAQPAAGILQFVLTLPARISLALVAVALVFLPIRSGVFSELRTRRTDDGAAAGGASAPADSQDGEEAETAPAETSGPGEPAPAHSDATHTAPVATASVPPAAITRRSVRQAAETTAQGRS